jgi:UDP-galactopyranose mutase
MASGDARGTEERPPGEIGEGMDLHPRFKKLAKAERHTLYPGRLVTYGCLDMWMAVAQAMVKLDAVIGHNEGA